MEKLGLARKARLARPLKKSAEPEAPDHRLIKTRTKFMFLTSFLLAALCLLLATVPATAQEWKEYVSQRRR
jgi:hypothetical protein